MKLPIFRPVALLVLAGALFLSHTGRLIHPASVGMWHDDTLLLASAKSLAAGDGYRLPSWPGGLPQTKYPPLYPATLAPVWGWGPEFPGNLGPALWLSAVWGAVFVAGCWFLLRGLGVGPWKTAGVTLACAAHPNIAMLSAALLTDIPFAALMVWCAVAADRARSSPDNRLALWAAAAFLASLAILTRTLGLALPLALAACAWRARFRAREWALLVLPLAAAVAWAGWTAAATPEIPLDAPRGYVQTLTFYASYSRFWVLSVPDWSAFLAMLPGNLILFLREPAAMCLPTPYLRAGVLSAAVGAALSLVILIGFVRRVASRESSALHWAFAPYAGVVLLWNYPLMWRFLAPFLPLFLLALLDQGQRFVGMIASAVRSRSKGVRTLGWVYGLAIGAAALFAAEGYLASGHQRWLEAKDVRVALAPSKQELYEWAIRSTPPTTRFIAYEDVLLSLHTGRVAVRPVSLTTLANYTGDEQQVERELALLADTADYIQADYWVVAVDDYAVESPRFIETARKRTQQLFEGQEPVFRSSDDRVRVFRWKP